MNEIVPDIFTWAWFSEPHGYNFNGYLVRHTEGNLCIDPVPPRVPEQAIDGERIELQKKLGYIPTRSDIARLALDEYLGRSGKAKHASASKKGH